MEERFNIDDCKVFDAKGMVLGRIASIVAKSLMEGDDVAVINAELSILSGSGKALAEKYRTRLNLQEKENPEHSPYWPRRPDMLFKRIVRGMLPYKKPSGKTAYRKLRVYMGVPDELSKAKVSEVSMKDPKALYAGYIKLKDLSKLLGYNID